MANSHTYLTDTYRRLAKAGLVALDDDELEIPHGCDVDNIPVLAATITPEGSEVVEAMLSAARERLADIDDAGCTPIPLCDTPGL